MSGVNFGTTLAQRLTPSAARAQALLGVVLESLRVAMPAVVVSFTPGPPSVVSVQPCLKEFVQQNAGDSDAITLQSTPVALPVLEDIPILVPTGGGFSFTLPIQAGDECFLIFGDSPLDAWLQSGGTDNNPVSQRRHSLSDAVAVFGLRSTPRGISGYSTSSAQLRSDDGSVVVELQSGAVNITAPKVTIDASDEVDITAANKIVINGNGKTIIEGKNFIQHYHIAPAGGGGTTPPV